MECNRDEAVRARDLAEIKYAKQDFSGAKKFALKAQQLFPTLEGLSQMLQVLEVHAVAQSKVGGTEMDWYGILQVDPGADDSTIKKQYRRLALLLHPDKNKSVGAEAAFKLIGEAFGVLSDKAKRQVHDMKRGVKSKASHVRVVMEPNVQNFQTPFTVPPTHNSSHSHSHHTSHTSHAAGTTFWTACPKCKMQYQYMRTYENYQLQCPKCKNVFLARDIHSAAPSNGAGGFGWPFDAHRQDFNKHYPGAPQFDGATGGHGFVNGGKGSFSSSFHKQASGAAFFSSAAAAAAAQSKVAAAAAAAAAAPSAVPPNNLAADVVQQTYAKVKRERVEAEKETKRKEKELRRREKEELRKEKGDLRKAREVEKQREAMDRLLAKRKENSAREESKRKVDAKIGRKLKRKRRSSDQEDDVELEDEDQKAYEHGWQGELPRRRSSRAKKNVATYKFDVSDDSDLEEFPSAKWTRSDGEENAEDMVKSDEDGEREAFRQQSENGTKGKSPADDNNHVIRGAGANGGEDLDGRGGYTERNRDDPGSAPNKDSRDSIVESSKRSEGVPRGFKLCDSPGLTHKTKPVKFSQQDESPSTVKDNHREGEEFSKSEDFRDEKSPSKSPRTLRMRVRSPRVPFHSQSSHDDDDQIPQQRVSSPTTSEQSTPSSEQDSDGQIPVPDPDFHDFDAFRTETDILPGQIWAVYDDQDGMPRFYARILKVTTQPFKAQVNWLEHCPASEEERVWTANTNGKLSITCGDFKMGKADVMDSVNTFSHFVMDRLGRGLLKIYPKKGQVWAVYTDPEQGIRPAGGPRFHGQGSTPKFEMVEILSEFCDKKGLRTGKLVKVRGFKTVFHRQDGIESFRSFKPEELVKFSHSVPNQRIEDSQTDAHRIPRGSQELDPASTPDDLMGASDPSR